MTQPRSTLVSLDDGVGAPGHPLCLNTLHVGHSLGVTPPSHSRNAGTPTLLERSAAPR